MKIKILFNKKKPWARMLAKKIKLFLKAKGCRFGKGADATILIGGDGTIFYNKKNIEGKVVGIGSEKSKVCQLRKEEWERVYGLLKGKIEDRITLDVFLNGKKVGWAINDAVLRTRNFRILKIDVSVDGTAFSFHGDGLIVSTPTGSTAYALSEYGAILQPGLTAYELVPLAPYMRSVFPFVTDKKTRITFSGTASLVLDGQEVIKLKSNDVIEIKIGKKIPFAVF
ncbi:MAG: NAD(+)/NADH kinase [Candidatus Anstonellales archaeon]